MARLLDRVSSGERCLWRALRCLEVVRQMTSPKPCRSL
jgi:hypothetical protein